MKIEVTDSEKLLPCQLTGQDEFVPGCWACSENHMHIVLPVLLAAAGYPDNEHNRRVMIEAAEKFFR